MISSARSRVVRAERVGGVGERVEVQRAGEHRTDGEAEPAASGAAASRESACATPPTAAPMPAPTSGKSAPPRATSRRVERDAAADGDARQERDGGREPAQLSGRHR